MPGRIVFAVLLFITVGVAAVAQQNPPLPNTTPPVQAQPAVTTPAHQADTVERSVVAIDYRLKNSTEVDFTGTALMPKADGHAKIEPRTGRLDLELEFHHVRPARTFGPEYLTYVLWAITPEGRTTNLGEVVPNDDGNAHLKLTTTLQDFGMVLTAEPYFAVSQPSEMVVAENVARPNTQGIAHFTNASFRALPRGQYMVNLNPAQLPATTADMKKVPLELLEAENALAIAQASQAGQYAPDTLERARNLLSQAQDAYHGDKGKTAIATASRAAVQAAEEARLAAIQTRQQEQTAAERRAAQERLETARSQAEAEAARAEQARLKAEKEAAQRALAEQQAQANEAAKQQAEQARLQAQQEAQAAAQQRQQAQQQAEQARLQAQQEAQAAAQQRQQAQQQAQQAQQQAQQAQQQAQQAQQQAQQAQQQAEQAQQQAQQAEQQRQALAQQAEQARLQAEQAQQEKARMREQAEQARGQLLQQLNQVMQTRDTAKGLIMTMSDVLFDTGKATLKPAAKVRLAKAAGIILAYPQLHIDVDGFTDSVGSAEYNQALSEQRAAAVRDFLISQGVPVGNVVARGFGESEPIASNETPQGRQQNRRVELVVSGSAIAANAGAAAPGAAAPTATGGVSGATTTPAPTAPQQQPNQPGVANPQPNPTPPPQQ